MAKDQYSPDTPPPGNCWGAECKHAYYDYEKPDKGQHLTLYCGLAKIAVYKLIEKKGLECPRGLWVLQGTRYPVLKETNQTKE